MTYTTKQQNMIDALKALQAAQVALFNARFDVRDIEGAAEMSIASGETKSMIAQYKHEIRQASA